MTIQVDIKKHNKCTNNILSCFVVHSDTFIRTYQISSSTILCESFRCVLLILSTTRFHLLLQPRYTTLLITTVSNLTKITHLTPPFFGNYKRTSTLRSTALIRVQKPLIDQTKLILQNNPHHHNECLSFMKEKNSGPWIPDSYRTALAREQVQYPHSDLTLKLLLLCLYSIYHLQYSCYALYTMRMAFCWSPLPDQSKTISEKCLLQNCRGSWSETRSNSLVS